MPESYGEQDGGGIILVFFRPQCIKALQYVYNLRLRVVLLISMALLTCLSILLADRSGEEREGRNHSN